jgi:hypothetical protein
VRSERFLVYDAREHRRRLLNEADESFNELSMP